MQTNTQLRGTQKIFIANTRASGIWLLLKTTERQKLNYAWVLLQQ